MAESTKKQLKKADRSVSAALMPVQRKKDGPPATSVRKDRAVRSRFVGRITLVKDEIAIIDSGSAQGMRVGMRLSVFRDSGRIAYFDITDVNQNMAAGTLRDVTTVVKTGDSVRLHGSDNG